MYDFFKEYQLDIMLFMSGICAILALFSMFMRTLSPKRRRILALLEFASMLLLLSDRLAYIYRDVIPQEVVRSELVKGLGTQFDEKYAKIMIAQIDKDTNYTMREHTPDEPGA